MNVIYYRQNILFSTARVILDDELFLKLVLKKQHSYIIGISHNKLQVASDIKIKHKKTANIYLGKSPEDLLLSFHDTCRNEIRRTFRMEGLEVIPDCRNFNDFYSLYKRFRKYKKLEIRPKSFFREALTFSAYYNKELIAVVTFYDSYPYLRIQNIFSRLPGENKELRRIIGYATRRLIYEICRYGIEHKHILLDLASVNLSDKAKQGITKFKMSFGGEITDEYTYTYRGPVVRLLAKVKGFIRPGSW